MATLSHDHMSVIVLLGIAALLIAGISLLVIGKKSVEKIDGKINAIMKTNGIEVPTKQPTPRAVYELGNFSNPLCRYTFSVEGGESWVFEFREAVIADLFKMVFDAKLWDPNVTPEEKSAHTKAAVFEFLMQRLPEGRTAEEFTTDFETLPPAGINAIADALMEPIMRKSNKIIEAATKKKIQMEAQQSSRLRGLLHFLSEQAKELLRKTKSSK